MSFSWNIIMSSNHLFLEMFLYVKQYLKYLCTCHSVNFSTQCHHDLIFVNKILRFIFRTFCPFLCPFLIHILIKYKCKDFGTQKCKILLFYYNIFCKYNNLSFTLLCGEFWWWINAHIVSTNTCPFLIPSVNAMKYNENNTYLDIHQSIFR